MITKTAIRLEAALWRLLELRLVFITVTFTVVLVRSLLLRWHHRQARVCAIRGEPTRRKSPLHRGWPLERLVSLHCFTHFVLVVFTH